MCECARMSVCVCMRVYVCACESACVFFTFVQLFKGFIN